VIFKILLKKFQNLNISKIACMNLAQTVISSKISALNGGLNGAVIIVADCNPRGAEFDFTLSVFL
jgi:hypothetical protein